MPVGVRFPLGVLNFFIMTIQEAIKARIDRFNRLYLAAVGHSFEDDPKWCEEQIKKEFPVWNKKVNSRLKELNIPSLEDYLYTRYYAEDEELPTDDIIEQLRKEEPHYSSLYPYEMSVIEQAKSIAEWFESQENPKDLWNSMPEDIFEFVEELKKKGFDKWDEDHSGNSAGMSVRFARTLLFNRDLFPYLHGALVLLVGDEGYHDDRSDIEQVLKEEPSKE